MLFQQVRRQFQFQFQVSVFACGVLRDRARVGCSSDRFGWLAQVRCVVIGVVVALRRTGQNKRITVAIWDCEAAKESLAAPAGFI